MGTERRLASQLLPHPLEEERGPRAFRDWMEIRREQVQRRARG